MRRQPPIRLQTAVKAPTAAVLSPQIASTVAWRGVTVLNDRPP